MSNNPEDRSLLDAVDNACSFKPEGKLGFCFWLTAIIIIGIVIIVVAIGSILKLWVFRDMPHITAYVLVHWLLPLSIVLLLLAFAYIAIWRFMMYRMAKMKLETMLSISESLIESVAKRGTMDDGTMGTLVSGLERLWRVSKRSPNPQNDKPEEGGSSQEG